MAKKKKNVPMTAREKAFYLKGKADAALNPNETTTQLLEEVLDTLIHLAGSVERQYDQVTSLHHSVDELKEVVHEVTELIQMEGESEDEFEDDFEDELEDDLEESSDELDAFEEDDDEADDEEEEYTMECPACGRRIWVDPDVDIDTVTCPACTSFLGDLPVEVD